MGDIAGMTSLVKVATNPAYSGSYYYICSECKKGVYMEDKFCRHCGKEIAYYCNELLYCDKDGLFKEIPEKFKWVHK